MEGTPYYWTVGLPSLRVILEYSKFQLNTGQCHAVSAQLVVEMHLNTERWNVCIEDHVKSFAEDYEVVKDDAV